MYKFASACTQTTLRTPATVTADGNSAGIDVSAYRGEILVGLQALNTAGSTPTLAIKLQHAQMATSSPASRPAATPATAPARRSTAARMPWPKPSPSR